MTRRPHVLVARLDNLGDVLLAGPAVRAVARSAGRVTFLCGPSGQAAAQLLPGVDEVLEFDAPWVSLEPDAVQPAAIDRLVASLGTRRIDEALVLTSFHQSPLPLALLLRLAGVGRIAATSTEYPGSLLDHRLQEREVHEVERSLAVAAALGHAPDPGDDGCLALRRPLPAFEPFADRYVVVHPGASVPARALPPSRVGDIVRGLVEAGWKVAVTGATDDRVAAATLRSLAGDVADLTGALDLPQLAAVLQGADAAVCGNTGPAHLSSAVGTPVVSVFAPVVPLQRWRPWRIPHVVLGLQDVECAGCRARVCPRPGQPCTAAITAGDVVAAVGRLVPRGAPRLRARELTQR